MNIDEILARERKARRKSGGPAFPHDLVAEPGMTLRDWFAGQALTGVMIGGHDAEFEAVEQAYAFADAMLKAREVE